MTEIFKENTRSYCSRILDDIEQLRYVIQTLKFSEESERIKYHITHAYEHIEKIKEHLISMEKL